MSKGRSKVHPSHKTRYRVSNWSSYDRGLRRRGEVTLWLTPQAIAAWKPVGTGARGGQKRHSDTVIEAALTVRLVFSLPWRQTEGLLHSLVSLQGLEVDVPDHTTLSRRTAELDVKLEPHPRSQPLHLVADASGIGTFGEGEWAAAKWGGRGRRGWRKLHVAVDEDGSIVAAELTDNTTADATAFPRLLEQVAAPIKRVTADGAYDRRAVYEAISSRGASAVIPPTKTAVASRDPALAARDAHLAHIARTGRRRWRQDVGHHRQARAENTFYRYQRAFGGRFKARTEAGQSNEALACCNILNRMAALGMPVSERVGG